MEITLGNGYEVHEFEFKRSELSRLFLPKLLGRVFHFTTSEGWEQIQACCSIDPNQDGKHGSRSVHSHKSMGRHLGAVCLFDLRNKGEEVLRKDWILYDYFERRWRQKPSYFLFLGQSHFPSLTTLDQLDPRLQDELMYIPDVESWHVGPLPLTKLEEVERILVHPD